MTDMNGPNSMVSAMAQISTSKTIRIGTGNIHRHPEIFKRIFKNSAEELVASIQFQLEEEGGQSLQVKPDGTILLARDADKCLLYTFEKNDMKTTLKVFMSSLDAKQVEEAVEAACLTLDVKSISQLIVSFPCLDKLDVDRTNPAEVQRWLGHVLPVWKRLEALVVNHKVYTLGVADLDFELLKALYENAQDARPMIDHYNVEHCCIVPPELRDYAKQKDIQLLTHNDPHLCVLHDEITKATKKLLGENNFTPDWIARLTVWLRSRSVICAKGYILQFRKIA